MDGRRASVMRWGIVRHDLVRSREKRKEEAWREGKESGGSKTIQVRRRDVAYETARRTRAPRAARRVPRAASRGGHMHQEWRENSRPRNLDSFRLLLCS